MLPQGEDDVLAIVHTQFSHNINTTVLILCRFPSCSQNSFHILEHFLQCCRVYYDAESYATFSGGHSMGTVTGLHLCTEPTSGGTVSVRARRSFSEALVSLGGWDDNAVQVV